MKRLLRLAVLIPVMAAMLLAAGCRNYPAVEDGPDRAVIVDQLHVLEPNPAFIAAATAILEARGFAVDLRQGENVTVDFYRSLPERGYKLLILRVHSGVLLSTEGEEVTPLETTYLFTGETYSTTKYVSEQLSDKVSNAMMTEDYPLVFAVNSELIMDSRADFDDAVVMAMGCESYGYDDMAITFVAKGASAYIGWNTVVTLDHVDEATINLLGNLCAENLTLEQAVERTMTELGQDPYFGTYLKHYPPQSGGLTLGELTR